MNDKHEIDIPVPEDEKQRIEAVLSVADFGDIIQEWHAEFFGDIHPDALANGDIGQEAILAGDLDPADVPSEYKIGNYDADGAEVSDDE